MLDVDRFQQINDRHGHGKGDEVLGTVAQELTAGVRRSDFVARYGGEEYLLVMPGAARADAARVAACLLDEVRVRSVAGLELPVTLSAGVAEFPADAPNLLELV
jgi:diguanylate cyclase (GGDEF)-like protein